ncbi:MAG: YggS family pyridoxal phosphate-dependent enzyme [Acidimicrobiaceae bacterium]|nr:YggS family pyridoxal phosphate-dependent enzyme [Acidimicrobiaceae bacterium]
MNTSDLSVIATRVAQIRARITSAGGKNVMLIAVTKSFDVNALIGAHATGCDAVGENYAQELITKLAQLPNNNRLPVHFIGRLQGNKVKSLADVVDVWQSVDRASLVEEIAKRCTVDTRHNPAQIMLQVNSTNEPEKGGCQPSDVPALVSLAVKSGLVVLGLMTVGPTSNDPPSTRTAFRLVRKMADDLGLSNVSMGMTGDLEIAVEEGTTAVRIGTALFGPRTQLS